MRPLLCFGEALIDFLHIGSVENGGLQLPAFRQFPGGAPANAAVALAKLGGQSRFAGQVGDDKFGHFLENALNSYGVDTRFLHKHPTAHTSLAFVFLDSDGERSFSFYRDRTADVLFSVDQVSDEWFTDRPVFHVCSNTLTTGDIAGVTEYAVDKAGQSGSLISFDVNLRPNLWPNGEVDRSRCESIIRRAHFLKCALEELEFLADENEESFVDRVFEGNTGLIVVTDGGRPVRYITREHRGEVETPTVDVVDTTAAGDAFTAGVIRGLCAASNTDLVFGDEHRVQALIRFAAHCGALTTTRQGAFPALPGFDEVQAYWTEMP